MEKTPLQRHLEETPDKPIIGLKLKDLKMWLFVAILTGIGAIAYMVINKILSEIIK